MLPTIIAAVVSFIATNIDDIVLLTFFFSHGTSTWRVVVGQYLGFAALVAISLIGYVARLAVPEAWIGLLGFIPIMIGISKLREIGSQDSDQAKSINHSSALLVATTTFSNGGDNIGIYVPLFASTKPSNLILIILIFFVMLGIWCVAGYFFGRLTIIRKLTGRFGHIFVPFALIGLGIYILAHNHTFAMLAKLVNHNTG